MGKARKGLEPGGVVRVVRGGGHWSDNVGNFAVPDDGSPLEIRRLPVGRYTAIDEHGNEHDFEVLAGEESVRVLTKGADNEGVREGFAEEPVPGEPGAGVATATELRGSAGEPLPAMLDGEVTPENYERLGMLTSAVERDRVHRVFDDDKKAARALERADERRREEKEQSDGESGPARPGDLSGDELKARAAELGVEGRSSMTADDLRRAIAEKETGVSMSAAPGETVENPTGGNPGGGVPMESVETDMGEPRDKEKDKADVQAQGRESRES